MMTTILIFDDHGDDVDEDVGDEDIDGGVDDYHDHDHNDDVSDQAVEVFNADYDQTDDYVLRTIPN